MHDKAINYYHQSLQLNPKFINARFDLANALALHGNFEQSLEQINMVLSENDLQSRFYNLKTLLLLWLERPEEAAINSSQAIRRTIYNKNRYFYNSGVALSRAGHIEQGMLFLKWALAYHPNDFRIICSLIENRLLAEDRDSAHQYALQLLSKEGLVFLTYRLDNLRTEYAAVPINVDLISPIIIETAQRAVAQLSD